nr:hypothetical protein [Tanacetum cinerariifolium]
MKRGFLSQKGSEGGRWVKEEDLNASNIEIVKDGSVPSVTVRNTGVGSYPPLPTQGTTPASNTPGKSSYANVMGESSKKAVNIHTLFTLRGNEIDVVVPVNSIQAISKRSSYTRVMIELQADVELKDTIVVAMPKTMRDGYYTCTIRVEYEWKPPRCSCCKVFGHTQEEYPKNIGLGVAKNVKKPSQTSRGISIGLKVGFKPQNEYRPALKKPSASSSSNKKKGVEPINEVSNSNPFEVLNSVDNEVELGTNRGTKNLVNNAANSSGSSFMNVEISSTSTTPVIDKIRKFEDSLIDGQVILVNETGNPLKKVDYPGDYDSEDEVASVDNDMARSMASKRVGFGTQSLLEQWRDSYGNGDYYEDAYDDDMYKSPDLHQEIQAICDNLDTRVRGRKKK